MPLLASVAHTADVIPVSICLIGFDRDIQVTNWREEEVNKNDSIEICEVVLDLVYHFYVYEIHEEFKVCQL
jgi:hypothetical protein